MRGLDDLLIRQIGREPEKIADYFGNFLVLRLALSAGLYVVLLVFLQYGPNYAPPTAAAIVILTLSVIPDSLGFVAQSILLGRRRFGSPAVILGLVNLFKIIVGAIVLLRGGSLMAIAWLWVIGSSLGMVALLIPAFRQVGGVRRAHWLNFAPLQTHRWAAMTFCAITTLTALDSQVDTILLSVFRGEVEVGWYSAATTVTFSLLVLAQAYRFAVYPLMVQHAQHEPQRLETLFRKSIYYMTVIAMPMVMGLIILAPQIVTLVFGIKFIPAIPVLQILSISLLFFFAGEPCNRLMLVKDRQKSLVRMLLISTVVNVILNVLLIPQIGAIGAAISRSCSALIFFSLNYGYIHLTIFPSLRMKSAFRPFLSTMLMAVAIFFLGISHLIINIFIGVVVYFAALWIMKGFLPEDAAVLKGIISKRISKV